MHTVDIKVLRVIHLLVTCGRVIKVAKILNVSPGAVTYLLNKARKATGSPLFVRTKNGMLSDDVAKELSHKYIRFIDEFGESDKKLDIGNREITISTYALIELMIAMRLRNIIENGKISFSSLPISDELRLMKLRNREIDIDIGTQLIVDKSIISSIFFSCNFKVIARKGLIKSNGQLSLKEWMSHRHVIWSRRMHSTYHNHKEKEDFYDFLFQRNTYCETSNSSNMFMMACYTDNLILMPEIIVEDFIGQLPFDAFDLPNEKKMHYECYIHYHSSMAKNPLINNFLKAMRDSFLKGKHFGGR